MLNEPTLEKLHALRLAAMAGAWTEQTTRRWPIWPSTSASACVVDAEHLARDNRRLGRLLKDAQLRLPNACIEDIEASPTRGIDKPLVRELGAGGWLRDHLNVLLCGPTGVGKSFIGCALGQNTCRRGHRVLKGNSRRRDKTTNHD